MAALALPSHHHLSKPRTANVGSGGRRSGAVRAATAAALGAPDLHSALTCDSPLRSGRIFTKWPWSPSLLLIGRGSTSTPPKDASGKPALKLSPLPLTEDDTERQRLTTRIDAWRARPTTTRSGTVGATGGVPRHSVTFSAQQQQQQQSGTHRIEPKTPSRLTR
ncbi:hypothetical protein HK405_013446, partial [Cladochytrium tenue]